jgi:hypothetical protein
LAPPSFPPEACPPDPEFPQAVKEATMAPASKSDTIFFFIAKLLLFH